MTPQACERCGAVLVRPKSRAVGYCAYCWGLAATEGRPVQMPADRRTAQEIREGEMLKLRVAAYGARDVVRAEQGRVREWERRVAQTPNRLCRATLRQHREQLADAELEAVRAQAAWDAAQGLTATAALQAMRSSRAARESLRAAPDEVLVDLQGSPRQIEWAADLRASYLLWLESAAALAEVARASAELSAAYETDPSDEAGEAAEIATEWRSTVVQIASASWWIEHRADAMKEAIRSAAVDEYIFTESEGQS